MAEYDLDPAHSRKFANDFYDLAAQTDSRFEDTVRADPDYLEGIYGYFDRVGSTSGNQRTRKIEPTRLNSIAHTRRQIGLIDYDITLPIDKPDVVRMSKGGMLPQKYLQRSEEAMKRDLDDVIVAALGGNAKAVDENLDTTNVALPAGQQIANGGTNITYAKILQAIEIMDSADVDTDAEELFLALSPIGWRAMMQITEFKSKDFVEEGVGDKATRRRIPWLGVTFIKTNRLSVASNIRSCFMWAKSGVGLAKGAEYEAFIARLPQYSFAWCTHANYSFDATRIEDEKVVQIDIDETA